MIIKSLTLVVLLFTISLNLPSMAANREGGVSGGGGNVIRPTPPNYPQNTEHVEHTVKASLQYTQIFLENKAISFQHNQIPSDAYEIYAKIFQNEKNIFSILQTVRPRVEEHQPCFDFNSKPVDASIAAAKPNSFCVSAYSLAKKVIHTEIPIQSAALMAHEYSEILGLSESEAVRIQSDAIDELNQMQLPPLEVIED